MSQVEERGFSPARGLRPAIDAQYGKVRFITPLQPNQMATTAEPKAPSWMTSFADGVVGFATVSLKIDLHRGHHRRRHGRSNLGDIAAHHCIGPLNAAAMAD